MPDTSTADAATIDDERFISVMASSSSNEFDCESLKEFADHVLKYLGRGKSDFEITAQQASRPDAEPATRLRIEYDGPDGGVVAAGLLALRLGVLHEIAAEDYDIDAQNFSKVVARFKYSSNYRCYGTSNNP